MRLTAASRTLWPTRFRISETDTFAVHSALIATQVIFGGGSVVGKLGVDTFNPMLFALIREAVAGVLLLLMALRCDGRQRLKQQREANLQRARA